MKASWRTGTAGDSIDMRGERGKGAARRLSPPLLISVIHEFWSKKEVGEKFGKR